MSRLTKTRGQVVSSRSIPWTSSSPNARTSTGRVKSSTCRAAAVPPSATRPTTGSTCSTRAPPTRSSTVHPKNLGRLRGRRLVSAARAIGLLVGVAADGALGDPKRWHPVAGFGRASERLEHAIYRDHKGFGAVYTGLLAGATVLLGVAVERAGRRRPVLQMLTTAAATWAVLGGRSLAIEGAAIGRELDSGSLDEARDRLPNLCGRDPRTLDSNALARAAVESVAENTSDAVVAPLVWGAIAGVPGLLGYRAVNTLDAMVGYRSPRYRRFGWASARLDDVVNLAPARLAAAL